MLEDAAYRGLSFGASEPPSLWSLDREGETVILARTFSKTFSPGLKIGYGVLPEGLIDPILCLKGNHDFGSANFNQRLLEQVLADGELRPARRAAGGAVPGGSVTVFLSALERVCRTGRDSEVHWTRPEGGLFVWMTRTRRPGHGFRRATVPAVRARGGALRAGRIRLRRRAGAACRGTTSGSRSEYRAKPSWSKGHAGWRRP